MAARAPPRLPPPPPLVDDALVQRLLAENERLKRELDARTVPPPPPPLVPHPLPPALALAPGPQPAEDVARLIESMFTFEQLTDLDADLLDTVMGDGGPPPPPRADVNADDGDGGEQYDGNDTSDSDDDDFGALQPQPRSLRASSQSMPLSPRKSTARAVADRDRLAIAVSDAISQSNADDLANTLAARGLAMDARQDGEETPDDGTGDQDGGDDDNDDDLDSETHVSLRDATDSPASARPTEDDGGDEDAAFEALLRHAPRHTGTPQSRTSLESAPTSLRERVRSISIQLLGAADDPAAAATEQNDLLLAQTALTLEERLITDIRDALEDELTLEERTAVSPLRPVSSSASSRRASVDLLRHNSVPPWLLLMWCSPQPREGVLRSVDPLVEVLAMHGYAVTKAISKLATISEMDEVVKHLMRAFEGSGLALELLERLIKQEVEDTKEPTTLFRSNSVASKLLSVYCRMVGKSFLQRVLGPVMTDIKELGQIEVDPSKNDNEASVASNMTKLTQATTVLESLFTTVSSVPLSLRMVSCIIRQHVEDKFAGYGHAGIAGFLFLRFICAAIAAPEAFGFASETPTPDERRVYVLVCKVLQNLANGVRFGSKETFMLPFNTVLEYYEPKLIAYFNMVSAPIQVNPASLPMVTPRATVEEATLRLASFLETRLDKLAAEMPITLSQEVTHTLLDSLKAVLREFPYGTGAQDQAAVANDFALLSRFEEVLISRNALLLKLLLATAASSKDLDSVCRTAVQVLSPRNKTLDFIADVLMEDLRNCDTIAKFCESQAMGFRLVAAYMSTIASGYLQHVLSEVVADVCATSHLFETTLPGGRVTMRNMDALTSASFKFFGCIVNSLSFCPIALRHLCARVLAVVSARYKSPHAGLLALAQMLFLRFFCPAIASPQAFQLVDTAPSERAHRALVVISYSLKHLAAGTFFKDPQLLELNCFLRDHADLLQEFIAKMATVPPAGQVEDEIAQVVPFDVRLNALVGIRLLFTKELLERLRPRLLETARTQTIRYSLVDRLAVVLADRYSRL